MKSYIVRIYRDEKNGPGQFLGTVERPGEDVKLAFTSFDELKNILGPLAGKDFFVAKGERQKGREPNQGETAGKNKNEDREVRKGA